MHSTTNTTTTKNKSTKIYITSCLACKISLCHQGCIPPKLKTLKSVLHYVLLADAFHHHHYYQKTKTKYIMSCRECIPPPKIKKTKQTKKHLFYFIFYYITSCHECIPPPTPKLKTRNFVLHPVLLVKLTCFITDTFYHHPHHRK